MPEKKPRKNAALSLNREASNRVDRYHSEKPRNSGIGIRVNVKT